MEDLVLVIEMIREEDAWEASYPGDPLVRPQAYVLEVLVNDLEQFATWLKNATESFEHVKSPERRMNPYNNYRLPMFSNIFYQATIRVFDKKDVMLFKLRFM